MNDVLDMLEKDRVLVNFRAKDRDFDLVLDVLPEVDSTNRYMLDEAVRGAMTGSACLARTQTAGRGRRGKSWLAPVGNIYLSLLWRFNNSFESVSGLSLVAGAAVAELVASYAVKSVALKWPNDVLCDGKKICGILVETLILKEDMWAAVVGVGLNVRMNEQLGKDITQPWTDLSTGAGRELCCNEVAGRLLAALVQAIKQFERHGLEAVLPRWNQFDILAGREVVATASQGETRGIAKGIDATGALLIEVDGVIHRVLSGDVSLRLAL